MILFEIILSLVTIAWSKETGEKEIRSGRFKYYQQIKAAIGKQEQFQQFVNHDCELTQFQKKCYELQNKKSSQSIIILEVVR